MIIYSDKVGQTCIYNGIWLVLCANTAGLSSRLRSQRYIPPADDHTLTKGSVPFLEHQLLVGLSNTKTQRSVEVCSALLSPFPQMF